MAYPGARWYTWQPIVPEPKRDNLKKLDICGSKFGQKYHENKDTKESEIKKVPGNVLIENTNKEERKYPKSATLSYKQIDRSVSMHSGEGKYLRIPTTRDGFKVHQHVVSFRHSATPRLEGTPKIPEEFDFTRSKTLDK